jgi:hypothetical protein
MLLNYYYTGPKANSGVFALDSIFNPYNYSFPFESYTIFKILEITYFPVHNYLGFMIAGFKIYFEVLH